MHINKRILVTGGAGIHYQHADITQAMEILGWEPKIQLEEGLIKTISYFETCLGTH